MGVLISSAITFLLVSFMMDNIFTALIGLFLIGMTVIGLASTLQIRLMEVAGNAQSLAASLNHSAFNLANALGAYLGGWVLTQNMGWLAPIQIGSALSLSGLLIFIIALLIEKNSQKN